MKYADLAAAALEASALSDQNSTIELHKSAADAHALARDSARELSKGDQGELPEIALGLVDNEMVTGHQRRYEWHIAKGEQLEKSLAEAPPPAPAGVVHTNAAVLSTLPAATPAFDRSALGYLLKGGIGSDKPSEQSNVEAGTEGDGEDDGDDANAPDEAEAEAAKEAASEQNEGPPPMAKNMDGHGDVPMDYKAEGYGSMEKNKHGEGTCGGMHKGDMPPALAAAKKNGDDKNGNGDDKPEAKHDGDDDSGEGKPEIEVIIKKGGLGSWLSNAGEEDALDIAAENAFSKSYDELVSGVDTLNKAGPYIGVRGGKWADAAHTIPWNDKKHEGKNAPTAKRHDSESARDLVLTSENDGDLHRQQHEPIRDNLARKMAAGNYDHAQATKLYGHMMANSSKKMAGAGKPPAHDPSTRMAAAKVMADQFHDEAMGGEHDHRVPKKYKGKGLKELHGAKAEKSMASDNGGLGDWLNKGMAMRSKLHADDKTVSMNMTGTIPGAYDHGQGRTAPPQPKGVRTQGLDERDGYAGNVDVGRVEEGGKLDGVGAEGGIGGGPAVRVGKPGINSVNSAAGDAYGANQGGPDVPQNNIVSGTTGELEQFTPDDPNDVDKMKDEHGMIIIPGAPASAYEAQGGQRSAASQGGPAYGDATAPMPGKPSSSAASASDPRVGSPGIQQTRNQGGPAYGPATGGQRSMRPSTHDPHGGASGTSPGAPSGSNPQVGTPGLHNNESSSKLFDNTMSKALDAQTGMPLHADPETQAEAQRRAQGVQGLRKGEADIQMGFGVRESRDQSAPLQDGRTVRVMMKGGIIMTDQSDQEVTELLKKGDFGYHGTPPGFDLGNDLTKALACPACGTRVMKALTKCPACGVDRLGGDSGFRKSMSPEPRDDIPQTHSKGPGLRRPVPERDLLAPDGLSFDD